MVNYCHHYFLDDAYKNDSVVSTLFSCACVCWLSSKENSNAIDRYCLVANTTWWQWWDGNQQPNNLMATLWLWGPEQDATFNHCTIPELTLHRCFIIWTRSSAPSIVGTRLEAGGICVPFNEQNREALCEKEALRGPATCFWMGRKFLIETDHKPRIPLLNTKHLDTLPPRTCILHFRQRLGKHDYRRTGFKRVV